MKWNKSNIGLPPQLNNSRYSAEVLGYSEIIQHRLVRYDYELKEWQDNSRYYWGDRITDWTELEIPLKWFSVKDKLPPEYLPNPKYSENVLILSGNEEVLAHYVYRFETWYREDGTIFNPEIDFQWRLNES